MNKFLHIGFMGADLDEVIIWANNQLKESNQLMIPFAGSHKPSLYFLQNGINNIVSYDTQPLSALVASVLTHREEPISRVQSPGFHKGWCTQNMDKMWRNLDLDSALLIDYISISGNAFDKISLLKAISACTAFGRLSDWVGTPPMLWDRFNKAKLYMSSFVGTLKASQLKHTKGSFFDSAIQAQQMPTYIYVDPPKVVSRSDVYSKLFNRINSMLTQKDIELPKWDKTNVISTLQAVVSLPFTKMVLMHTSEAYPSIREFETYVLKGYDFTSKEFSHGKGVDIGYIITK